MKKLLEVHVPHNTGWSAEMKQGQIIRIMATTTVDFVFSNYKIYASALTSLG